MFTDEQLVNLKARYKDHTAHCQDCECSFGNLELPAILARLDAAESCAGYLGSIVNDDTGRYFLSQWHKARGDF